MSDEELLEFMEEEGGFTTLFYDTFTDIGTVALEDHTPEIGGPWVLSSGTIDVILGQARYADAARARSYIATGESNIYILASATRFFAFTLNLVDDDNYYLAGSSTTGNIHYAELSKIKGGVVVDSSIIGPVGWADTSLGLQKIEVQAFNGVMKVRVSDPGNPLNFVESTLTDTEFTSGNHGLRTIFAANYCTEMLCRTTDGTDL